MTTRWSALRPHPTRDGGFRRPMVAVALTGALAVLVISGLPLGLLGASPAPSPPTPLPPEVRGPSAHLGAMGNSSGYLIPVNATSGNLSMGGTIRVTNSSSTVTVNALLDFAYSGHPLPAVFVNLSWGDSTSSTGRSMSNGTFSAFHAYTSGGTFTLVASGTNTSSGARVVDSFSIFGPTGTNGSGTSNSTVYRLAGSAAPNSTLAANLTLWLNSTIYPNAPPRDVAYANLSGSVTGGTTPYNETIAWGTNSSPVRGSTSHHTWNATYRYPVLSSAQRYLFQFIVIDAARASLYLSTGVSVPGANASGSGGNSTTISLTLTARNAVGPWGVATEFAWNITGGTAPYLLQINSSDGWYSRNVSTPSTGTVFHTYPVGASHTNYTVFAFATQWPPNSSVRPGSASLVVFPSYSYILGSTNSTGNAANGSFLWLGSPGTVFAVNFSYVQTNLSYRLDGVTSVLHGSGPYGLTFFTANGNGVPLGSGGGFGGNSTSFHFVPLNVSSPGYYYVTVVLAGANGTGSTWGIVHPTLFRSSGSGGCGCDQQLHGSYGGLSLVVNLTFNATPNWFTMQLTGFVNGGLPAYQYQAQFAGGNTYGTTNGPLPSITIGTSPLGNVTLYVNVTDSRNITVGVSASIYTGAPNTTGNGSGHSPYPAPVSVVVAADPVLGTAPLGVTLSAYISGGAPPFTVDWSLPGSTTPSHATGVSVVALYNHPGWYPATAFVYNTTTPHGSVLVGFGSVWVDVRGTGSSGGNGSGNGSGGGHGGYPGRPVTPVTSAGGQPAASGSMLLWGTLLIGAIVGGVVGVVIGSTRPRLTPRSAWERGEAPPPRSRP